MRLMTCRLAITGGGTGGHLVPAIAVIETLQQRSGHLKPDLLYLGSRRGAEAEVIPALGVTYRPITTGKLRRYLSAANVADLLRLPVGVVQSLYHLSRFRPHALLATGGYVSVPPVLAASALRIPVVLHEQTGRLGLANRINARFAKVIALSVPGSASTRRPTILTGNPIRRSLLSGSRQRGLQRFGFVSELPLVYVTGGAQGAHFINELLRFSLTALLPHTQILHQCGDTASGKQDYEALAAAASELPDHLRRRYTVLRFVGPELGDVYAAADLVVGRAGAGTVNELTALHLPAVLIPLPHAAGDEQRENARRLVAAGGAVMLEEAVTTPVSLQRTILDLLAAPDRLTAMREATSGVEAARAADRLADLLLAAARGEPFAGPDAAVRT